MPTYSFPRPQAPTSHAPDGPEGLGRPPPPPPYEDPYPPPRIPAARLNILRQIARDPDSRVIIRRQVEAIFIPFNGTPHAVTISVDFVLIASPPFVRVFQEHVSPFLRGPVLYTDVVVDHADNNFAIRAFRGAGSSQPINRCIHHEGHPLGAWRGDVLVLGRGPEFFFVDLNIRWASLVLSALAESRDRGVPPVTTVDM